jgi:hypothetical protein
MIHTLNVKDLQFFLQMQLYIQKQEMDNLKVYCDPKIQQDLINIKENISWFAKIMIYPELKFENNLINGKTFEEYTKKNDVFYGTCHLTQNILPKPANVKPNNYIFVEDYKGDYNLPNLAKLSEKNNIKLLSLQSFNKTTTNTQIDKTKYNFCDKLAIIHNCAGYVGYDYSLFAPVAYRFLRKRKICILKSNKIDYIENIIKYHPAKDLEFLYNDLADFLENKNVWPDV